MKRGRFNYWKLTALAVALAMSLVQGAGANRTRARAATRAATFDSPNLSSEARTVDSFNDDLVSYDKKRVELSKRSSLTNEEFNALERNGNDLKRRVVELKDATESIVRKLKAAGRWDNLDEEILAKFTDAKDRAFVRDNGGLRHILESAGTDLNSQSGDEIVAPLSLLRSKVAQRNQDRFDANPEAPWRTVAAGYQPPASNPSALMARSVRCIGATIRYAVGMVVHGTADRSQPGVANGAANLPPSTNNKYRCQCFDQCGGAAATQ